MVDRDGELELAFRLATKAVSMDSDSAEANVALTQTFLLRGQHDDALRSVKRAIENNPSYAAAHAMQGWAHALSGDFYAAIDPLSRAVRLQPNSNGVILGIQGSAYYLAGRYDEAAAILEVAVQANLNHLTARVFLVATYQRLGKYEESEWEAQEVAVLSPEFKIGTWHWVQTFKSKNSPQYLGLLKDLQASGLTID